MQQLKITRHAKQRLQQRGVQAKELEIVMGYADIEVPARNGCRFLRLSDGVVTQLLQQGRVGIQDLDRAKRLLVLADPADRIVTVLKHDPQRKTRAPKRGWGAR